ncbi:MAG: hypothetical protein MZV65_18850 [Chromatiales bacterium]|nr:hypothetical protein [Chromatiales bacterium]
MKQRVERAVKEQAMDGAARSDADSRCRASLVDAEIAAAGAAWRAGPAAARHRRRGHAARREHGSAEQAERRVRAGPGRGRAGRAARACRRSREQVAGAGRRSWPQSYEQPAEVVRWYYSPAASGWREVEALVIEDNVVDWVLSERQNGR